MNYYGRRRYYSYRYPRRSTRRTYSSSSRSKRRAIGNYRAAIKQQDKTDVNLNIMTKIQAHQGTTPQGNFPNGVCPVNIWDLLRRSEFYKSYANMYDQIKINSIRIKLTPLWFRTGTVQNNVLNSLYSSYTVVTAWDRTGLGTEQTKMIRRNEANDEPNAEIVGNIGTEQDDFGFYVLMTGKDLATYSSAITRSMGPNSNTNIVRTLYPSTIQEKGLYVNTSDLKEWYEGFDKHDIRYWGIRNPNRVVGARMNQFENTLGNDVAMEISPFYTLQSYADEKNPTYLVETPQVPFKPTFLVGLLNDKLTIENDDTGDPLDIIPRAEFALEADVGVTFRGLRKSPVVE